MLSTKLGATLRRHVCNFTWTPIATDRAIPHEAEVDWLKGIARAPASWELRLDSSRFCFFDRHANKPLSVDASDVFSLEDVRPNMTLRTVLKHASKWMRSKASPAIAQAVDHDALRLAIVPEGVNVGHCVVGHSTFRIQNTGILKQHSQATVHKRPRGTHVHT
jgi:hypothetical protein